MSDASTKTPQQEPKGPTTGMLHRRPSSACPLCPVWGIPWDPNDPETWDKQHVHAEALWKQWDPGDKSGRWIGRVIETARELGIEVTPEQVKEHFSDRHRIEQPMLSGPLNHDRALYNAHQFSERAQAVINAAYRQHVLMTRQIIEVFYRPGRSLNAARQAALSELSLLAQGHFLYRYYPSEEDVKRNKKKNPPQFSKSALWYLGKAGVPYIKERYGLSFYPPYINRARDVKTETMKHDLKANGVFASICEGLNVRKGEVDLGSDRLLVEARPENWYGPGPQALMMGFIDPYAGAERRIMPDGFASLSIHRSERLPNCQLPFFYEFDNGSKETKEVVDQMVAYHLLALSGSALKRFPDLDVDGYAVPMLIVFSERKRMERVLKAFKEHTKVELGLDNGAPIFAAFEGDWSGDPFGREVIRMPWLDDGKGYSFIEQLSAASQPLIEAQAITADQVLRLDASAASPSTGDAYKGKKKSSGQEGAGLAGQAPKAPTAAPSPAPTPGAAGEDEDVDEGVAASPAAADADAAIAGPEGLAAETPTFESPEEEAADLAARIVATRSYLAELEGRLAEIQGTGVEQPVDEQEAVEPAPQPEPAPEPQPAPAPEATPQPAPEPEPAPAPMPEPPAPQPAAEPQPAPTPEPEPAPAPQPEPPAPEPEPAPAPQPEPPAPEPQPAPEPAPTPPVPAEPAPFPPAEPTPQPEPPAPEEPASSPPAPEPAPAPSEPAPMPEPPVPAPAPSRSGFPSLEDPGSGEEAAPPAPEPGPVAEGDPLAPTGLEDIDDDAPEPYDMPDALGELEVPPLPENSPMGTLPEMPEEDEGPVALGPVGEEPPSSPQPSLPPVQPEPELEMPSAPAPMPEPPAPPPMPEPPAPPPMPEPPAPPPMPEPPAPPPMPEPPAPPPMPEPPAPEPAPEPPAPEPVAEAPAAQPVPAAPVTQAAPPPAPSPQEPVSPQQPEEAEVLDPDHPEVRSEIEERISQSAAARRAKRRRRRKG